MKSIVEHYEVLKGTGAKLWPYFKPSCENLLRTTGLVTAFALPIVSNVIVRTVFLTNGTGTNSTELAGNELKNDSDILTTFASVATVALFTGAQYAISTFLTTSTMQAMKEKNTQLLMDKSKFLMHGDHKDITSLQYVTVGVGVRDFATNAVPIFVALPMYTISSVSTLINIGYYTESFKTSGIVLSFVAGSGVISYLLGGKFFSYNSSNQNIENNLVGRMGFIEAYKDAVSLMEASDEECLSIMQSLQQVNTTIPKLSLLNFFNTALVSSSAAIASQFLGGYYTGGTIKDLSDPHAKVLNVMILSLLTDVGNIVTILTNNYSYVKLNLEQLRAFDKAYDNCSFIRETNNKMKQEFDGDKLSLIDFCVYKPNPEVDQPTALITLFNNIRLKLLPNKVYKLSAESGSGKTTLLKAITNNWQYTDGVVKLPTDAKDNICFIPQHSFIPPGTILEILAYPLKPQKFLASESRSGLIETGLIETGLIKTSTFDYGTIDHNIYDILDDREDTITDDREDTIILHDSGVNMFIDRAKQLLINAKLLTGVIRYNELESENINWNIRLSGGEKQKLGIIRAILTDSPFIIMDEATSALDTNNKQIMYKMIIDHINRLKNYMVIYTDHSTSEYFADAIITITGQSVECHDIS